jgi:hypothetical protein
MFDLVSLFTAFLAAPKCERSAALSQGASRGPIFDWSSGRPLPNCRQPAVAAPLAHDVPEARKG